MRAAPAHVYVEETHGKIAAQMLVKHMFARVSNMSFAGAANLHDSSVRAVVLVLTAVV